MSFPTQPLHRSNFFVEARQLISANNGHFLSLNILFLFPLWFFIILFPLFLQTMILSQYNGGITPKSLLSFYTTYSIEFKSIALSSLYTLFLFSLSIVSIATVTYSTHQGFYRRPLTLITTIKSLSSSFFPLASTISLILFCITAPFALFLYAIKIIDSSYSNYFISGFRIYTVITIVGLLLLFCQVYCVIASVIAVVESKWGVEPLHQSYYLIKRMKLTSLSVLLLYGFAIWCVVLGFSSNILYFGTSEWSYSDLLQVANTSLLGALFTVQFVAASTVLYMYKGEWVVLTMADEDDSSLTMDDELKLTRDAKVKTSIWLVIWICFSLGITIATFVLL